VGDLTDVQRKELKIKAGVRVDGVADAAARAGLREGDVIVAAANTEVTSVKDLESILGKLDKSKPLTLLFKRGEWTQYAIIKANVR
jgi:serine protease Do